MKNLCLVGSGSMGRDYASVLKSIEIDFTVIGRGEESARSFEEATGLPVQTGGLEKLLSANQEPEMAIVAVGDEQLVPTTKQLIQSGTRRVLLEKPGGPILLS